MPTLPTPRRLRQHLDDVLPLYALPGVELGRTWRKDGWTVRQALFHLADTETVFLDRLRRITAEENPLLLKFDQDAWVERLDDGTRDLALAGRLFAVSRETIIELIAHHGSGAAKRQGIHNQVGVLTFAQIGAKVFDHCEHHLTQIRQALGRG